MNSSTPSSPIEFPRFRSTRSVRPIRSIFIASNSQEQEDERKLRLDGTIA
jgi:hypothetical protein